MNNRNVHSFHIPVLGIGYSIDTPVKVAHLGISSVVSLVDDILIEKMREFYSQKFDIPFQAISDKIDDFRAKRITAYLNLIDSIARQKFDELKSSYQKKGTELQKYLDMLPDTSQIKEKFLQMKESWSKTDFREWFQSNFSMGSIDVNIMTKVDKDNYKDNEKLPVEFNDGHAALRGFANSTLHSSVVLSAGMSPRLYAYLEKFKEFFPNEEYQLGKKITLKVSDYRSALIQGKYLAKKGLWVSEYRVESGLNCGGHAFPTEGHLLGPILEEFKTNRELIIQETHQLYIRALKDKNLPCPEKPFEVKFTAQGGVGTAEEHQFLLDYYNLDSVGWGTPFLLVPEVVNLDDETLDLLSKAKEDDLYLSNISPLGVPFNNLKNNTKDKEKNGFIDRGIPGSVCNKKFASLNTEFPEKSLCTASRRYQYLKIKELNAKKLSPEDHQSEYKNITAKACICVGLGTSALLVNELDTSIEKTGVSVCPGPNLAYFSEIVSLRKMTDHIYGKTNIIKRNDRPNMFIKELILYVDYLKNKISETTRPYSEKQKEYFETFRTNLNKGIEYYQNLFASSMKQICSGNDCTNELSAIQKLLDSNKMNSR